MYADKLATMLNGSNQFRGRTDIGVSSRTKAEAAKLAGVHGTRLDEARAVRRAAPVTLDELLRDPGKAAELPADERQRLAAQLAAVQIALLAAPPLATVAIADQGEQWLSPDAAGGLLGKTARWVFTMAKREDWQAFVQRPSRKTLRVERRGLLEWLERRTRLERKRRHRGG